MGVFGTVSALSQGYLVVATTTFIAIVGLAIAWLSRPWDSGRFYARLDELADEMERSGQPGAKAYHAALKSLKKSARRRNR